jgi:hypothetical protein
MQLRVQRVFGCFRQPPVGMTAATTESHTRIFTRRYGPRLHQSHQIPSSETQSERSSNINTKGPTPYPNSSVNAVNVVDGWVISRFPKNLLISSFDSRFPTLTTEDNISISNIEHNYSTVHDFAKHILNMILVSTFGQVIPIFLR